MVAQTSRAMTSGENLHLLYRELPSVDQMLSSFAPNGSAANLSHAQKVLAARRVLDRLRNEIAAGRHNAESLSREIRGIHASLHRALAEMKSCELRPVINATGVVLHTNLGRAPLSPRALAHIAEVAGGYCNLEFDLRSGLRGKREQIVEERFLRVLSMRAAIPLADLSHNYGVFVANNGAAAMFLTLHALAAGGEVLVSRGELIEIGGGFRIPEILERAGAVLREIGTTNRTRIEDYANAITERTKLILRVHRSNFRITGFTERPEISQLLRLGRKHNLPVVEDQGTGSMIASPGGSTFPASVAAGVDAVIASGDKLFGGPQAGFIAARRELMKTISRNPLARAFRVDKLTYAALEATLLDYESNTENAIPVLKMLSLQPADILSRAEALVASISRENLSVSIRPGHSVIGGGAAPEVRLRTHLIAITHRSQGASALRKALRDSTPAVIARVVKDRVVLDLRTVTPESDALIAGVLNSLPA
jgi:L-seryl-tRNA(Ser) seleniumtransferase